ncbi:hypothetical protein BD413DRAFT_99314 [Trametes elegans]|nr:hypothetical protein BD413DRAFT_99314 [Trametes elegans]
MPRVRALHRPPLAMTSPSLLDPQSRAVPLCAGLLAVHSSRRGPWVEWTTKGRRGLRRSQTAIVRFVREAAAFPRPTFHDAAASAFRRPGAGGNWMAGSKGKIEIDCNSPAIGSLFTSSLSSTVFPRIDDLAATRPDFSLQNLPPIRQPSSNPAPPVPHPARYSQSPTTLSAFLRSTTNREREERVIQRIKCRPYAIKMGLAELLGPGGAGTETKDCGVKEGLRANLPSSMLLGDQDVCDRRTPSTTGCPSAVRRWC